MQGFFYALVPRYRLQMFELYVKNLTTDSQIFID
jgi:hypothetical protein